LLLLLLAPPLLLLLLVACRQKFAEANPSCESCWWQSRAQHNACPAATSKLHPQQQQQQQQDRSAEHHMCSPRH
jgi:hypothetical protein